MIQAMTVMLLTSAYQALVLVVDLLVLKAF